METRYGVQIFGCLGDFRQDPAGFFQRLAAMGYRQIEPCVLFGDGTGFPQALADRVWKPREVSRFQAMMEPLGLSLSSCHVFCPDPLAAADEMLALAEKTSIDTYVVNCPRDIEKTYRAFAQTCHGLAARLAEGGVALWLHNNAPEIRARAAGPDGEATVMEAILQEAGDKLGAQVDTGWVLYGGVDPAAFLRRLGGRLRSVHFKDMAEGCHAREGAERFAVLGAGVTDIPAVMEAIPQGMPILVDQDVTRGGFFADLEASIQALRAVRP